MPGKKTKRTNLIKQASTPLWISAIFAGILIMFAMAFNEDRMWDAIVWPDFFHHLQDYPDEIPPVQLRIAVMVTDITAFLAVWMGIIVLCRLIASARGITVDMLLENVERGQGLVLMPRFLFTGPKLFMRLALAMFALFIAVFWLNYMPEELVYRCQSCGLVDPVSPGAGIYLESGLLSWALTSIGMAFPANVFICLLLMGTYEKRADQAHEKSDK